VQTTNVNAGMLKNLRAQLASTLQQRKL